MAAGFPLPNCPFAPCYHLDRAYYAELSAPLAGRIFKPPGVYVSPRQGRIIRVLYGEREI